ncbi:MAG TPA: hypothetical protein VFV34_11915 [Blastocatellia bacterium]|nr:hypothetical protein [Blastocatellia bacterium]
MKIGGHGLREHLRLLWPLLVFIAAVWLLRLVVAAAGLSRPLVQVASVTGAAALSVLVAVVMMHFKGFGGYVNVVVTSFTILTFAHLLIVLAILFSVAFGGDNVFTRPEYSLPTEDAYHLRHILGHLTFGVGAGTVFGAAAGCLLLWLLRTLVPNRIDRAAENTPAE